MSNPTVTKNRKLKLIPGLSGYGCDKNGNVFNLKTNKKITPIKTHHGYLKFNCVIDKKHKEVFFHRAVALAWIGLEEKKQVNHKNGIKTDNRLENLEWVTCKENAVHARKILGLGIGEKNGRSKLKESDIKKIRSSSLSEKKLASQIGISKCQLNKIKNKKSWAHVK